ncbi:sulfotransferase family 2 domain-containing protein [uncultured Jatrophihabitans sp.]|uniref:sulfotransferase family 2 domain-containing protein n=1 Tax=uncultured Jatrophihabitans sp. TaxID=1610747 RepID=UPI0035C9C7B4
MPFTPLLASGAWPPGNSWVLRDHKIVYVSTTKVSCSSLRWMIADLAGEDFTSFYRAPGDHQTRLMTIHAHRDTWEHAPQIKHVPPEQRAEISRDNGWFIFAVVRDPWTRLFSAWQSKLLVRHASYVARYADQPWFPRVPKTPEDVLTDWRTFVRATPWLSHAELRRDPHFMPQVDSVHPDIVNYSRIYSLSEMRELQGDLHAHLAGLGRDQELYLPRANESPLRMTRECLDAETAAAIAEAYRVDFVAFPGRWELAELRLSDAPWTADAIDSVGYHGVANERIGDLSRELRAIRDELREARRQLRAFEREARWTRWAPGIAVQGARQARAAYRARRSET